MIESHLSLSLLTEIRQVAASMARLDVSNIISQWLHHLETDQGMMDRLEVVYRARYEVGEQQSLVEAGEGRGRKVRCGDGELEVRRDRGWW